MVRDMAINLFISFSWCKGERGQDGGRGNSMAGVWTGYGRYRPLLAPRSSLLSISLFFVFLLYFSFLVLQAPTIHQQPIHDLASRCRGLLWMEGG